MNIPFFVANKISKGAQGGLSQVAVKISVFNVALAITILILAFNILKGFKSEIKEKIFGISAHVRLSKYKLEDNYETPPINTNDAFINKLQTLNHIALIQNVAYKPAIIRNQTQVQGVVLKGITHDFNKQAFNFYLNKGFIPNYTTDTTIEQIVISRKIANALDVDTGSNLLIYFMQTPPRYRKLTVAGIYNTGMEEFDDKFILCDLNTIRQINQWEENQTGSIEIFIKDFNNLDKVSQLIFEQMPYDFKLQRVTDLHFQLFDWLKMLDRNNQILLVLVLLVASFSIVSTLVILILERTQMIGMLKTLGFSNQHLNVIFSHVGLRIIIKGLLYGNLVGIFLCVLQKYFQIIKLDPASYYMDSVPILFDWVALVLINIATTAVIMATLLFPLKFLRKITPANALRFK